MVYDASTPTADDDSLLCEPVNSQCGCAWDCALLRELPDGVFVRLDSEGEQQFRRDDCSSGSCFQLCGGEGCRPALVPPAETCTEACPPARAPFSCRRVAGEATDPTGSPCQRESGGALDRSSPNAALRVRLEGCPSKEGFTGRVEQQDDGAWTIVRL